MKTRIIGLMVSVGFAVGFAAACETEQPPASCPIPHTSVWAHYMVNEADAAKPCGQLTGEWWSISKYNVPGTTENELAFKPDAIGNLISDDPRVGADHSQFQSRGDFDFQATDGFCHARDLSPITISLPAEAGDPDAGVDPADALDITYEVSDFRMVGTAQVPGTQFDGTLTYTENGCTATYKIIGIAPWVPCEKLDAEGNPELDADGNPIPDDARCNSSTLPDGGLGVACNAGELTGGFAECLNPDFNMKCNPANLVCIPAGDIPSLKE